MSAAALALAVLVAGATAAGPAADVAAEDAPVSETAEADEEAPEQAPGLPPLAGWVHLASLAPLAMSYSTRYLSAGFTVHFADTRSLVVELGHFREHGGDGEHFWEYDYGIVAVGLALQRPGAEPLTGAFVQPKVIFAGGRHRGRYSGEFPSYDVTEGLAGVQIGLDVGYQWRWGPLYVTPIIGASAGAGVLPYGFISMYPFELTGFGQFRPSFDLNLNLLRLGAVF